MGSTLQNFGSGFWILSYNRPLFMRVQILSTTCRYKDSLSKTLSCTVHTDQGHRLTSATDKIGSPVTADGRGSFIQNRGTKSRGMVLLDASTGRVLCGRPGQESEDPGPIVGCKGLLDGDRREDRPVIMNLPAFAFLPRGNFLPPQPLTSTLSQVINAYGVRIGFPRHNFP